MYITTPEIMKKAEENAVSKGMTWAGLMENAGTAAAEELTKRHPEIITKKILVICGKGNNGGDGFVIARLLSRKGARVTVLLTAAPSDKGAAADNFAKIKDDENITVTHIDGFSFDDSYGAVVDAAFGTGFHGELPEKIAALFNCISISDVIKAAVDIPSGADSISGSASENTLKCDFTVTFGAVKVGMTLNPAKEYCGEIITAPIGIDSECLENAGAPVVMDRDRAFSAVPKRNEHSHKGSFGRLLIIGGSENMSGAAALNVMGALRSGAGLVKLASVKSVIDRVGANIYESTFLTLKADVSGAISAENIPLITEAAGQADVIAIGSGMTVCDDTVSIVRAVVNLCGEKEIPLIIDADGLNCIAGCIDIIRNANCKAVLTPHIGELARLLGTDNGEIMSDRLSAARRLSQRTGAVIAAKGVPTFIVSPQGCAASYTGNGGLSRGGSGDVLTGVISGITAMNKGRRLFESVCSGVYFFGAAADIAAEKLSETGMLPSDAAAQLPFAFGSAALCR